MNYANILNFSTCWRFRPRLLGKMHLLVIYMTARAWVRVPMREICVKRLHIGAFGAIRFGNRTAVLLHRSLFAKIARGHLPKVREFPSTASLHRVSRHPDIVVQLAFAWPGFPAVLFHVLTYP